jgi:hypothetical protein
VIGILPAVQNLTPAFLPRRVKMYFEAYASNTPRDTFRVQGIGHRTAPDYGGL